MSEQKEFVIKQGEAGMRLDKYLAEENKQLSRSYLQQLIADENVLVNQEIEKKSYQIEIDDQITLNLPEPEEIELEPEEIELEIIYEDGDILVVNKPAGLVVHPGAGNQSGTLVNALLAHCDDLSGINGKLRPGIVHRLDKDTSGAIVVAKNDQAHRELSRQFKEREVKKIYLTLVYGELKHKKGKIDAAIGRNPHNRKEMTVTSKNSKRAVSNFELLANLANVSLVKVDLETGRTHQIRVHFDYIGYPVVGDQKYGTKHSRDLIPKLHRQFLHASRLGFKHPITGQWQEYQAELSSDLKEVLTEFNFVTDDL